eukprot:1882469-Lingulodinium_polyedra.AAC.1
MHTTCAAPGNRSGHDTHCIRNAQTARRTHTRRASHTTATIYKSNYAHREHDSNHSVYAPSS